MLTRPQSKHTKHAQHDTADTAQHGPHHSRATDRRALRARAQDQGHDKPAPMAPWALSALLDEATRSGGRSLPQLQSLEDDFGRSLGHIQLFTGMKGICRHVGARAIAYRDRIICADHDPSMEVLRHEITHCLQNTLKGTPNKGLTSANSDAESQAKASASAGPVDLANLAPPDGVVSCFNGGEEEGTEEESEHNSNATQLALSAGEVKELRAIHTLLAQQGPIWDTLQFSKADQDAYVEAVMQGQLESIEVQLDAITYASSQAEMAIEQGERLAIAALAKLTDPDPFADLYPDDPMVRARELPAHPDHLQLANAVCDSADALRERLQAFRSSLHTKLKLPHCAPHKEAITNHAGLEFWLMGLRLELTDTANMSSVAGCLEASWAFVSSEWADRDQLQQDALALASSYPDDKATLILHCLGHQCANHASASALQPFLMLIAGVNQSFSRYLTYLEQFGDMGEGAMLASMVFLLDFSESILDMIGTEPKDAYNIVEGHYSGQLHFTEPLTDHPVVAVLIDDIATFVMNAHRFGESYQQCTNPSLDEASQQLWAQEAHKAYAKVTAVGVSSLAIQRFLHPAQVESDRYPQIGEQLTTQLHRIQEGIEAKLAGMLLVHSETAPNEPGAIDPAIYQTKLAAALKDYDEASASAALDFGLEMADISAFKAFKGYYDLANEENPAGFSNTEKADRVKTIAGMNKDAMDATLNLLEGVEARLAAKAAPKLMDPKTSAQGLRMSHAASQTGQVARRLTPIFQKGMLGMDIATAISSTAVMLNSQATWSERTNAGFDLTAGLVGTAKSIGVLAGASWAAAGTPLTILIAYFKMMYNVFKRMESSRQLSLYHNRLELLARLAIGSAKAASNAQTTLAAAQAESTGAAQTQMSAAYAEQTRLAFRVVGRHVEESSSAGWDAFEAVYDHWSDWSEEQDDLRDALQGDAFKKLTADHVTPETIASHHHTVLNDVKGIMERLETKLDQAKQGGSSKG